MSHSIRLESTSDSSVKGPTAPAALPSDQPLRPTMAGRAGATDVHDDLKPVRLSEVVGAMSFALDITEGQPMGHASRTALIAMRIATELGLPDSQRSGLYYAAMLKDLGCSSNAARLSSLFGADDQLLKHAFKLTEWTATRDSARYAFKYSLPGKGRVAKAWHMLMLAVREQGSVRQMVQTRCERGADIARMLRLPLGSAEAIRALDEHWDGSGLPSGLRGSAIPMLARIVGLAQTVEVFQNALDVRAAYEMAHARRGSWFDPVMVDCLSSFELDAEFWHRLRTSDTLKLAHALEPEDQIIRCDDAQLDIVAEAFARVIDAKSPYTSRHSYNVAAISTAMGEAMSLSVRDMRTLRRAALLHDIGKLGVSNRILDKPAALDDEEWTAMRQHTRFTLEILKRVARFRQFAATAAAHHERLDGSGYHLGLRGAELNTITRIIAVADVTEALSADRPYRAGMPIDAVHDIIGGLVDKSRLCPVAFDALRGPFTGLPENSMAPGVCLVA